jgi:hypothetical protein
MKIPDEQIYQCIGEIVLEHRAVVLENHRLALKLLELQPPPEKPAEGQPDPGTNEAENP